VLQKHVAKWGNFGNAGSESQTDRGAPDEIVMKSLNNVGVGDLGV
jgi:hypothetical protein